MKYIKDALEKMSNPKANQIISDWKKMLPPGSRWHPGDPGKPDCKVCEGTGFLRVDVSVNHPNFGKIFLCDCVDPNYRNRKTP